MSKKEQPQTMSNSERLINNKNVRNDTNSLPNCYGDYSGGVYCLACFVGLQCARVTAGGGLK